MTENISERIENAIKDIEKTQIMFRKKYGEECIADKEIEEVLKIAKVEHDELQQYRSIGTVEECREAVECRKTKRMTNKTRCMTIIDAESYPYTSGSCPKCGYRHYAGKTGTKYCPWCGQDISWEGSED